MSAVAIRVEGLSKQYKIGGPAEPYGSLRESLARAVTNPFRRLRRPSAETKDTTLWALRDVSFEVKHGEVVGIIGRNGAGKSTLLKVLSRITEPTKGRIDLYGRVGALLEVGTGFHPELTGRENIMLNGTILGMSRNDIRARFDEIVAFAEVERFIDTPVKRYSSGMYLRLAFAVAAHLEPDILVVDEVLAVGDAHFQKKCLGKMGQVAREGRTVLFVSHSMAAVESLCQTGLVLHRGHVQFLGTQVEAVARYLTGSSTSSGSLRDRLDRRGSGEVRVVEIQLRDLEGKILDAAKSGQDVDICLLFEKISQAKIKRLIASLSVKNQMDVPIFLQHNRLTHDDFGELPQSGSFICRVRQLPLPASAYRISFSLLADDGRGDYFDVMNDAGEFNVVDGDFYGSGEVPPSSHGVCLVNARWQLGPSGQASDTRPVSALAGAGNISA